MENLYANVPRNLARVKTKVFLNLTKRQLICFGKRAEESRPENHYGDRRSSSVHQRCNGTDLRQRCGEILRYLERPQF